VSESTQGSFSQLVADISSRLLPCLSSLLILDWSQLFCTPITSLPFTIPDYWINLKFPIPFLHVKTRNGGIGHYTCRLTYLPCDRQLGLRGEVLLTWAVTELNITDDNSFYSTSYRQHRRHYPRQTVVITPELEPRSPHSSSVEITEQKRQDPRSPRPIASSTDLHQPPEETPYETVPSSPFAAFT
jgi:hypothetical protein